MKNPKENRRIFEGIRPAIIELGQWERVQALRADKRRPAKIGKTSIFSGFVRCADCRAKLYGFAQEMLAQDEAEQAEIQRLAVVLKQGSGHEAGQNADVGRFLKLAEKYSDLQELDAMPVFPEI